MKNRSGTITCISLVLLAVTAVIVFAVNRSIPFMMDDLWYSTHLYSEEPIRSFSDIIDAQIWHWNNWGGRSITHSLLQMILICGEDFADILNTVFVFILSLTISLTAGSVTGRIRNLPLCVLAGCGLMTGLNANWKLSMFWESGAANYLYITVFILLFIFCYLREIPSAFCSPHTDSSSSDGSTVNRSADASSSDGSAVNRSADASSAGSSVAASPAKNLPGITIWMAPLAIIAGWSNENMGPVCFIVSVITMLAVRKAGRKISLWMPEGSLLSLAGSVMCIAAPGNFVRNATIPERGTLWKLFLRCYSEMTAVFRFQIITVLTLVSILVISTFFCGIKLTAREKILLLCALLSWGAMFLSPHYPDRATFGTMCLMIVVIISRSVFVIRQKREALIPLSLWMLIIWGAGMYDLTEFLAMSAGWIV
ncbi:MAG: hypothetical protein ILP17_08035 [Lachnospiraceae bacterium]|nr:hypothetical protein [Lachnospiraceae bacterium]